MSYTNGEGLDYFEAGRPADTEPIREGAGWLRDIILFLLDPVKGLRHYAVTFGLPTGTMVPTLRSTAPAGYVLAQGQTIGNAGSGATLAGAQYASLFEVVKGVAPNNGTEVFASGDVVTLPNLARRTLVGAGGTSTSVLGNTVGSTGGTEGVTLTAAQSGVPAHVHTVSHGSGRVNMSPLPGSSSVVNTSHPTFETLANVPANAQEAHNNMPPAFVTNVMIKL